MSDPRSRRSSAAELRNPLLRLPAAQRLRSLPPEMRRELAAILHELSLDARKCAEQSWRRNKAAMAASWKAVSVYAGHLRRLVRPGRDRQ